MIVKIQFIQISSNDDEISKNIDRYIADNLCYQKYIFQIILKYTLSITFLEKILGFTKIPPTISILNSWIAYDRYGIGS